MEMDTNNSCDTVSSGGCTVISCRHENNDHELKLDLLKLCDDENEFRVDLSVSPIPTEIETEEIVTLDDSMDSADSSTDHFCGEFCMCNEKYTPSGECDDCHETGNVRFKLADQK
jgi:hypothetical protein